MFVTRLLSGIVLVAILLVTIGCGGWLLFAFLTAISLIGMFELYRATGILKDGKKMDQLTAPAYLGAIVYDFLVFLGQKDFLLFAVLGTLIALLFVYVLTFPKYKADEVMTSFFGLVYVTVCLSCIYMARMYLKDGMYSVWLIIICSWGCDTLAYCAGRLFGKHKMTPQLSPKKTVEGAVGGVAGAGIIGAIYAAAVGSNLVGNAHPVLSFTILGASGALISMVGDLAASAIKRDHQIKDYGKLIPGHGGILDHFDSVIITAPIIYFLAAVFEAAV